MRRDRTPFMAWLLSPLGSLILVSLSYAWLIADTDFSLSYMSWHLSLLGTVCISLGLIVVWYRFDVVEVSGDFANRLLNTGIFFLGCLSIVIFSVTGGSVSALLDQRFSIPAFGLIYSLYFTTAIIVAATWKQQNSRCKKIIFLTFFSYVGFVVGGKGFALPFIFGLSLAQLLGLQRIRYRWFFALFVVVVATAIYVVYTAVGSFELVWLLLSTRISLTADAILWLSKMDLADLYEFPVSSWQIFADLFSRWIGLRLTQGAVGSVVAEIVSGDDGGGGPNPLLPVMAYLVNRGNILLAFIFVIFMIAMLYLFLFVLRRFFLRSKEGSFFYAVLVFLSPLFLVDVFLYWQIVVCLVALGLTCLILKLIKKNIIRHSLVHS